MADPETIAAYNRQAARWAALKRSDIGTNLVEQPAMHALLPASMAGVDVAVVGCGSGEEIDELEHRGAHIALALDAAEQLTALCRERHPDLGPSIVCADMDTYSFGVERFDYIYSGWTLHYAEDLAGLVRRLAAALKPGGELLFSVQHPLYRGALREHGQHDRLLLGFEHDGDDVTFFGDYLRETWRTVDLFGEVPVRFRQRTIAAFAEAVFAAGLKLTALREPALREPESAPAGVADWRLETLRRLPICVVLRAERS